MKIQLALAALATFAGTLLHEPPTVTVEDDQILLTSSEALKEGHFATAAVCSLCHAASENAEAMTDAKWRTVAPYDLWRGSMMANSARDPLWRAAVSAEVATIPAAREAIEAKCMRCHSPMASEAHAQHEGPSPSLALLYGEGPRTQLALDGVSCTLCHQIQPENLGKAESFSGHWKVGHDEEIFGPHDGVFPGPMRMHTGFTPTPAKHVTDSAMCGSCHNLFTRALDDEGNEVGPSHPEQTVYLEWRNSVFDLDREHPTPKAASCAACHLPTTDVDGEELYTRLAHNPRGFDFPFAQQRRPFGRHVMVGGNTLVPRVLSAFAAELRPNATSANFAEITDLARAQLRQQTARISIEETRRKDDRLEVSVRVQNLTGHKFPTGIPFRRAWIRLRVLDADDKVVFSSGEHDEHGRLVDDRGHVLASERAGAPTQPHRNVVESSDQVAGFETTMVDLKDRPTFRLMRAAHYARDDRLLPEGWSADHPDAADTAPIGVEGDEDFLPGSDGVRYLIELPSDVGPCVVEADLLYQTAGARFLAELYALETAEIRALKRYLAHVRPLPERVARSRTRVP